MSNRWTDPTPDEPEDARPGKDDAAGIARDVAAAARHAPAGDSGAASDPGMDYGWDVSVNPADPPAGEGAAGSAPTPEAGAGSTGPGHPGGEWANQGPDGGAGDAQFVSYHQDNPGSSAPQADWVHPDDATVVSHPDADGGNAAGNQPDWVHPDDAGSAAGAHSPADSGSAGGPDWVHPDAGGQRPDWVHPDDLGATGGPGSGAPDWVNPSPPPADGGSAAASGAGGPDWVNPNPPPGAPSAGTPPHAGGSGAGVAPGPQPGPHHPVPGTDGMVNAGYGGTPPTGPGAMAQPPAGAMPQAPTPQPQWYGHGAPGAPQGIGPAGTGFGPGMPPAGPPPGIAAGAAQAGAAVHGGAAATGATGASSMLAGAALGGGVKTVGLILAVTLPLGFGSYQAVTHLAERADSPTSASENLPPLPSAEYVLQVNDMESTDSSSRAFYFQGEDGTELHCATSEAGGLELGVGVCAANEDYWDFDGDEPQASVNLRSGKPLDSADEDDPIDATISEILDLPAERLPLRTKVRIPPFETGFFAGAESGWIYYDGYYLMRIVPDLGGHPPTIAVLSPSKIALFYVESETWDELS